MNWRYIAARARIVLIVVPVGWAAFFLRFGSLDWTGREIPYDARAYHLAARAVEAGERPYPPMPPGPHLGIDIGQTPAYLYPPPFAAFVAALTDTAPGTYRLVLILDVLGILGLSYALARLTGTGWTGAGIALLLLALGPSPELIATGNVQTFLEGLTALSLVVAPPVAAFLLATGTAIKVTPFWALGVVLARTRSWSGFLAAVLLWAGVAVALLGVGGTVAETRHWLTAISPNLAQGQMTHEWWLALNVSPAFAPLYLLVPDHPIGVDLPAWARAYLTLVQLGVPALTLWWTRRLPWNLQAGWVIVAAALSGPILRVGYLPILLLVPALWWRGRRGGEVRATDVRA